MGPSAPIFKVSRVIPVENVELQILYLDPNEDRISAQDKLGWMRAACVIMVWPKEGRVLSRRLDLFLLQRYAERMGIELGILSYDPEIRSHARELRIPVFDSLQEPSDKAWNHWPASAHFSPQKDFLAPQPDLHPPQRSSADSKTAGQRVIRWVSFAMGLVAILSLLTLLIPSATITLSPPIQTITTREVFALSPIAEQVQSPETIPAQIVSVTIADQERQLATGQLTLPATASSGEVVFTNLTVHSIHIPEGTRLLAREFQEVSFATVEAGVLPAEIGGQTLVPIQATLPGSAGNLPANAIDAIYGSLSVQATVINPKPTIGGEEAVRAAVSENDIEALEILLTNRMTKQAAQIISDSIEAGERLAPSSLHVVRAAEHATDYQNGDVSETVCLSLELQLSGLVYHMEDMESAIQNIISQNLSPQEILVQDSMGFQIGPDTTTDAGGQTSLSVTIHYSTSRAFNEASLRSSLRGLEPLQAASLLSKTLPLARQPVIQIQPTWWPYLPWLQPRIRFEYGWENDPS